MSTTCRTTSLPVLAVPGVRELRARTRGHPEVRVAVLDGPVDAEHPALVGAALELLPTLAPTAIPDGPAWRHGTRIGCVLFGQPGAPAEGLAPRCSGIVAPIFGDGRDRAVAPCSQLDLARALLQAAQRGAHVINVSGGEREPSGEADPLLREAIAHCVERGILVVAAAGNDGCACLHVPGALPSVLAVGAVDAAGAPLPYSNWGERYRRQGIVAPGEYLVEVRPDGEALLGRGTSFAAAFVSGIAALLLSLQKQRGARPDPLAVRDVLLRSATPCHDEGDACLRWLAGRLDVREATALVMEGGTEMADAVRTPAAPPRIAGEEVERPPGARTSLPREIRSGGDREAEAPAPAAGALPGAARDRAGAPPDAPPDDRPEEAAGGVGASACDCGEGEACSCGAGAGVGQWIFALGRLDIDLGSRAQRDSILQHIDGDGHDPARLLDYLDENPWEADAIAWTLNLEATPIYAVRPYGPFAEEGYRRLRRLLREQLDEGVERISVGGSLAGRVQLSSGQSVPIVVPQLRCMYSWSTAALLDSVLGEAPAKNASSADKEAFEARRWGVRNFLERVYHELRNLGATPRERALNYAATNALNVERIFEAALKEELQLDTVEVERSPLCRPGSQCWEVKLTFFHPRRQLEQARRVYRFTVDVSEACPVMVGAVRSWYVR